MARLYRFMGFETLEWSAEGAVVRDVAGKAYIDCAGYGVFFHGHRHPKVVEAVKKQLDLMPMSTRILPNRPVAELGRLLAEVAPGDLQYCFFCNSGTEAVEGALKLARARTGKRRFIAANGAFHGKTFGSLSVSGRELYRKDFYPLLEEVVHVPFGDAEAVERAINDDTAAVILEPIQGEGGVIIPPDDYLPRVREVCTRKGVLLILDEVQTGIGRTGKMFACEHWGVTPDIMTVAKSLGGGIMPIGAFIATPEVWKPFDVNPYVHSSTFGGNPLACAAGVAALKAIEEEGLLEQAATKGEYIMKALQVLRRRFPAVIKDVRGKGLLIGLEMTKEGAGGMVISETVSKGVLVLHSLNNPKVIRIMPPAVITMDQIECVLAALESAFEQIERVIEDL